MDKIRFEADEAAADAAVTSLNAALLKQDPLALDTFKVKKGSTSKYYILGIPTAREAEFDAADEDKKMRMALCSTRAMSSTILNESDLVAAYEAEYTKEFS